jgi:hypothetical protein
MLKADRKITEVNRDIIRIFAYSAIKINANIPLLYSTLNPDTSSDSPSAKSNGVRFVSARFVINHITVNGVAIRRTSECICVIDEKSKLDFIIIDPRRIIVIDTSYEIVWATPRRAPSNAYLEFEHHPARNVE